MTEGDLRVAMRDPRYWQSGHPERAAYAGWVTEGWQRLHGAEATTEGGTRVVQVQAYDRVRNGRREHVDPYEQRRRSARGEGGGTTREVPGRAAAEPAPRPTPARPTLVIFVGGLFDSVSQQVLGTFNLAKGSETPDRQVRYTSHDRPDDVWATIRAAPTGTRIVLVGHSWGADTVATIAGRLGEQGRPVDMLVTIDPVGRGLSEDFMRRVRAGAQEWINVNAAGGSASETSNLIAEAGRKYGRLPERFASRHIDAPYTHAQFLPMMSLPLPGSSGTLYQRVMGQ